jgi:hypothetical protein
MTSLQVLNQLLLLLLLPCVLSCRYEFFAPIWRVMRDDNMAVSEVQRQIEGVALAVKQGSSVSDLRHHTFTGKLKGAQVRKHGNSLVMMAPHTEKEPCDDGSAASS